MEDEPRSEQPSAGKPPIGQSVPLESWAEPQSAAQMLIEVFDSSPEEAGVRFSDIASDRAAATSVLRFISEQNRPEVAVAITDSMAFHEKSPESVVMERARALGLAGSPQAAAQFLEPIARHRKPEYGFCYSAGRLFMELRAPELALPYLEAALPLKTTPAAADRLFVCQTQLGLTEEACRTIGTILDIGNYRESLVRDFAAFLKSAPPGSLDVALLARLAEEHASSTGLVGPILPHLLAADMADAAASAVDGLGDGLKDFDEESLIALMSFFSRHQRPDMVAAIARDCSGMSQAVSDYFIQTYSQLGGEQLKELLSPEKSDRHVVSATACIAFAERLIELGDMSGALEMLERINGTGISSPETFYRQHKRRLSAAVSSLASHADDLDWRRRLLKVIACWAEPEVKDFFAGAQFAEIWRMLRGKPTTGAASERGANRLSLLQEKYFDFHLERRIEQGIVAVPEDDFALCELAVDFFESLSHRLPIVSFPLSSSLRGALSRTVLSIGTGKPLDLLTTYAIARDRPALNYQGLDPFGDICWWYLTAFVPAHGIPPEAIHPAILTHSNEVMSSDDLSGFNVTRFLDLVWSNSSLYRDRFDRNNLVDRVLFVADLVTNLLPQRPHYLPLFRGILGIDDAAEIPVGLSVFLRPSLEASGPGGEATASLVDSIVPNAVVQAVRQEILLVGHVTKTSGLGRNFRMLRDALRGDDTVVAALDVDFGARELSRQATAWRNRCAGQPIVVFAVNAQDVPEIYAKDSDGALADCYSVGFFLWETSRAPQVQQLGINLVDEIWSPTRYVADIYAPLGPTHVVGKGLYLGTEAFPAAETRTDSGPLTFVSIFDFDSSIERKNPLAVVQAFQEAFRSGENVRLIIKASNVNPRHWSNSMRQWERLRAAGARDERIEIVTARYSDRQMAELIQQAACVVSLHRAEGFGYVIADAMAYGTPVIATGYSGNVDFCTDETCLPVSYRLTPVDSRAVHWRTEGAEWAEPDPASAAAQMRRVYEDRDGVAKIAQQAQQKILADYSVARFKATLRQQIQRISAEIGGESVALLS
jgi:glycosyltransferase involved in cell wall biosynthesis